MGPVWHSAKRGGHDHGPFDHRTGAGLRGAAVRTAVPQSGRRDAHRGPARRHPDARQAAAGGGTVGLGKHCGHRLPDAGCRGLPCRPGTQRLLCTGISGAAAGRAGCTGPVACPGRAGARRAGTAGAVRPVHPGRGPGAVSLPHLGAAAEGTAVLLPGAADQRRRPG